MAIKMLTRETEDVELSRLQKHPENPHKGNAGEIAGSISSIGFFGFLIAQKSTGYILVGNHTYDAAKKKRMKKVPVAWADVDDETAKRIMLADNRLADHGQYDNEVLVQLLNELKESEVGLQGIGYSEADLDALIAELTPPLEDGADEEGDGAGDAGDDAGGDLDGDQSSGGGVDQLPPSMVRQVPLFLNQGNHDQFLDLCNWAKERFEKDNITDAIFAALEYLRENAVRCGLSK